VDLLARSQDGSRNLPQRPFGAGMAEAGGAPMYDLIELMFFAYRDFVGDADHLLAALGFGRAHHRVLHFVSRRPGLTIAELLEILKITKQSLNRVLRNCSIRTMSRHAGARGTAATANCFQRRAEKRSHSMLRSCSRNGLLLSSPGCRKAPNLKRSHFFSPWSMKAGGTRSPR